jgi:hypothetical protein
MNAQVTLSAPEFFSPAVLMSLEVALTNVYWFKTDLRSFLGHTLSDRSLLRLLDWNDNKRRIVATLVGLLSRDPERYGHDLHLLMKEVAGIQDFSHLERFEESEEKVKLARDSVSALRRLLRLDIEQKEVGESERNKPAGKGVHSTPKSVEQLLARLREEFSLTLHDQDSRVHGLRLAEVLRELFSVFEFDVSSFRLTAERIEGTLKLEDTGIILEARWQGKPVGFGEVLKLGERVWREPEETLGLFLSLIGFAAETTRPCWDVGRPVLLMDGGDLMAVLDERIDLTQLLLRKKRHAMQSGEIFLPAARILVHIT